MTTFKLAYSLAKKANKGIFTWKGKTYNTMSKGDTVDEFRKKHADYDAFIGNLPKDTGGWKVKDSTALANKLNYVPELMTPLPTELLSTLVITQLPLALFSNDDIRLLGFRNYNGLVSAITNLNNANNNFVKALVARYGNDTSKWNQKLIEKDLGVKGTYRSFGDGDFGDMSRSMAGWLGTYNGSLVKPNESTNYWISKYITPQVPLLTIPQFKLYKNGGQMINYYLQGGQALNMQQQVILLVQAAMQGNQKANLSIKLIMDAALKGDLLAAQIALLILQVVQLMQGSRKARLGAKLTTKSLPALGNPIEAFKKGCNINKDSCGKKLLACGGKSKKKKLQKGGWINLNKGIWNWDSMDRMNRVAKFYLGKGDLSNEDHAYLQLHQDLRDYLNKAYATSSHPTNIVVLPTSKPAVLPKLLTAPLVSSKLATTPNNLKREGWNVSNDLRRAYFNQWSNYVNRNLPQLKGKFKSTLENKGYKYNWNTGEYWHPTKGSLRLYGNMLLHQNKLGGWSTWNLGNI